MMKKYIFNLSEVIYNKVFPQYRVKTMQKQKRF
jgi:hypothetical protein